MNIEFSGFKKLLPPVMFWLVKPPPPPWLKLVCDILLINKSATPPSVKGGSDSVLYIWLSCLIFYWYIAPIFPIKNRWLILPQNASCISLISFIILDLYLSKSSLIDSTWSLYLFFACFLFSLCCCSFFISLSFYSS